VVADAFISSIPSRAYEVRLSDAGSLQWVEQRNGETVSLLPIEWLL
jgi:hypothetical protein